MTPNLLATMARCLLYLTLNITHLQHEREELEKYYSHNAQWSWYPRYRELTSRELDELKRAVRMNLYNVRDELRNELRNEL